MIKDILLEQSRIEEEELCKQREIEEKADAIFHSQGIEECSRFLTDYSTRNALSVIHDWWKLSDSLIVKYSNGLVNDVQNGVIESTKVGYPKEWLGKVGYQYGPRIYQYQELQEIGCVQYVDKTVQVVEGTELEYIKENQTCQSAGHRKPKKTEENE